MTHRDFARQLSRHNRRPRPSAEPAPVPDPDHPKVKANLNQLLETWGLGSLNDLQPGDMDAVLENLILEYGQGGLDLLALAVSVECLFAVIPFPELRDRCQHGALLALIADTVPFTRDWQHDQTILSYQAELDRVYRSITGF